jgi:enamine deaminase RidA (YjgF/YER057c/UK114 family)
VNTAQPPASTAVQVGALFQTGYLLEIEAIAVIP